MSSRWHYSPDQWVFYLRLQARAGDTPHLPVAMARELADHLERLLEVAVRADHLGRCMNEFSPWPTDTCSEHWSALEDALHTLEMRETLHEAWKARLP